MKMPLILAAAALVTVGCDQQSPTADNRSGEESKDTIQQTARDAKSGIEKEAEAKKEMIEAEAKAAQARIEAENARAKAATADAQTRVESAAENIRDAGAAGTRTETQTGTAQGTAPTPPTPPTPGTSTAETDQRLIEQVKAAVAPPGADATAAQTIQITAAGSVVTLKGNVTNEAEKSRVETAAKAVPGVTKVENQLEVKSE